MSDKCRRLSRRGKSLVLKPRCRLSLGLGGGLADQQFDIAHVKSAAVQHFHKAQLQEDLQGPLHSANLLGLMVAIICAV